MSAPPQLPQQDRADFERVLEQALAAQEIRAALPAAGLTAERLRALARGSAAEILDHAAEEYVEYARVRAAAELSGGLDAQDGRAGGRGLLGEGGGLVGALAVLAPMLAGTAAVALFLVATVLRFADSQRHLAAAVVEAGWTAAIIAAGSAVCGVLGLLVTASRQRDPGTPAPLDPAAELRQARAAWRTALLERGMLPFLRAALGL